MIHGLVAIGLEPGIIGPNPERGENFLTGRLILLGRSDLPDVDPYSIVISLADRLGIRS